MIISQNISLYDIYHDIYEYNYNLIVISYMILCLTRLEAQHGNHFDKYFD